MKSFYTEEKMNAQLEGTDGKKKSRKEPPAVGTVWSFKAKAANRFRK